MAGDWIKMQVCLPDKPEVWRIASIVGCEPDAVIGKLLRVWSWFDTHTEDGNAHGVTFALVDRIAGVTGFAEAMNLSGWLDQSGTVLTLPKFSRHNGESAKSRATTNERVAKHRESKRKGNTECNVQSVTKTVTREEKRREEKYSAEFEQAWTAYPDRPGKSKADSFKAWSARLKGGEDPKTMIDGVHRYAAYCAASGTEPNYIKQPATFFGPGEHYKADWIHAPSNGSGFEIDHFAGCIN